MQDSTGNVKEPFSRVVQQLERGLKVVLVEARVPMDVSKIIIVREAWTARLVREDLIRNW